MTGMTPEIPRPALFRTDVDLGFDKSNVAGDYCACVCGCGRVWATSLLCKPCRLLAEMSPSGRHGVK